MSKTSNNLNRVINNINNRYMFKNAVRFFINIESFESLIDYDNYKELESLSWTTPINFPIRKKYKSIEHFNIQFPNILNFHILSKKLKSSINLKIY